ncbi:2'-5' RNA ligase family protein [Nocardioides mesophilus]|uniref:2'-5' RNA ligase family protein n=1 Tax=Nocardioides mesophilus TaxID=433659 RepID=A0A7G9R9W2_9ACTN|nr:2'-5' RNA ligase family protein [Nocardioides mesophilus]QNN52387.1 2'-5' RNA ligase family protein [Nocardioides mesophilus]
MALSVCLLADSASDFALRALWRRLEDAGIGTLLSHTHGHHVPHLTFASLLDYDLAQVRTAVAGLPDAGPTTLPFDALGMFRRSRCWLAPAASSDLARRQEAVVRAIRTTPAELHRNYEPGSWTPHLTLAPRLHLEELPVVARLAFEVLPLLLTFDHAALIDTSTGVRHPLPHVV